MPLKKRKWSRRRGLIHGFKFVFCLKSHSGLVIFTDINDMHMHLELWKTYTHILYNETQYSTAKKENAVLPYKTSGWGWNKCQELLLIVARHIEDMVYEIHSQCWRRNQGKSIYNTINNREENCKKDKNTPSNCVRQIPT